MLGHDLNDAQRRALAALLDWHRFCGVDLAIDDAPHDRYAESVRPSAETAPRAASAPEPQKGAPSAPSPERAPGRIARPAAAPVFPEEAARAAAEAAAAAQDLGDLARRFEAFEGCGFKAMAQHFLLGAGTAGADLMLMELAPGEEEERSGAAFDGARGRLADALLKALGRTRDNAYLSYFSPWRLPGDKTPTPQEAAALLPFARRHIELARPRFLIAFGEPLARVLFGAKEPAARLYGGAYAITLGELALPATAAPALKTVLATPTMKRAAWRALRRTLRG